MTVAEAWQAGREHLAALGIDEAGITAEVLLRHAMGVSRTGLYLAWDRLLAEDAWTRYQAHLAERARGRPVAYIVGRREFMGLEFAVDERVLIPRPETEVLVETVLRLTAQTPAPVVVDVGTGSGAIAISLAVLRPDAVLVATDISPEALEVARANAARHDVASRVQFLEGDLLEPVIAAAVRADVVACNPPYVAPEEADALPAEIRDFEPRVAVVAPGGPESLHRRLVGTALRALKPGGWLVVEVAAGQAARVVELLRQTPGYRTVQTQSDTLGWERVVSARRDGQEGSEGTGELLSPLV
ncbi:MAG: peptide chain release factor N(5)-glutamine methyltransferase [Armatimonadetes bacterium]|nr:peptide chain release factor N(5)-glutamine methyltransferase [Armatimonadota bacterium]